MLRSLLNALGPGAGSRFSDWPETTDTSPSLNIAERKIGPMRFGSSIEEARALGRPTVGKGQPPTGASELLYPRLGLLLQFDDAQGLDYAAFLVAPDPNDPRHANLRHQSVTLSTGAILTAQTTESNLIKVFGTPLDIDRDEEETVLFHVLHGLQVECELTTAGTLKRLNVFPARD